MSEKRFFAVDSYCDRAHRIVGPFPSSQSAWAWIGERAAIGYWSVDDVLTPAEHDAKFESDDE